MSNLSLINKNMRIYLFKILFLLGALSFVCGCSSNDNTDSDFSGFILDNNISEKWDGFGLPSWLKERYSDFLTHETGWMTESYYVPALCRVYKFAYKGNLLLALAYNKFGVRENYYYESGTICYTDDGRRVKFEKIKDSFEKSAVLLWTNEMDGENTPQVTDFELGNTNSLGWLQEVIDKVCKDIQEPNQLLCQVTCGYAHSNTYIVLDYEYLDKDNLVDGPQIIRNVYTLDGEKINIPELKINEEDLCSQKITDILAHL